MCVFNYKDIEMNNVLEANSFNTNNDDLDLTVEMTLTSLDFSHKPF